MEDDESIPKISQEEQFTQPGSEPCSQKTEDDYEGEDCDREAISCSVLCSLGGNSDNQMPEHCSQSSCLGGEDDDSDALCSAKTARKLPMTGSTSFCPKQLQLPMFLSST
jgi:hypothetical protein